MKKLIYLSPSNHGNGANKCLAAGCWEDKHTRPIAEVCAKHLRTSGFEVIVATAAQSMAARCRESDARGAALHVPIHTNAAGAPSARYLMLMFYRDSAAYRAVFNAVAPALEAVYPDKLKAKFATRADLYEINCPRAKTMYCELGFHTNKRDCDSFIHDSEKVGKALARGICSYFGVPLKEDSGSTQVKPPQTNPPQSYAKGMPVNLNSAPLYIASTSTAPVKTVTGIYYLWDGEVTRNRLKITNLASRVGVPGQVTGWIDKNIL